MANIQSLLGGSESLSRDEVLTLLGKHKDKNFIQRILAPGISPVMPMGNMGGVATHLMAAEIDPQWTPPMIQQSYAFPTVFQSENGELQQAEDVWAAFERAKKSGDRIPFDSIMDAIKFTESYKKAWQ